MSREQYLKQYYLCSGLGLAFALAAIVAHSIERFAKVDLDLGFALLWVAVFMFIQGYFQHLQSLRADSSQPQTIPLDKQNQLVRFAFIRCVLPRAVRLQITSAGNRDRNFRCRP
jgi:hypothetical protein